MLLLFIPLKLSFGLNYCNDLKFSDREVWANSADPDQTAPRRGLHCLQFRLHLLGALLFGKDILLNF